MININYLIAEKDRATNEKEQLIANAIAENDRTVIASKYAELDNLYNEGISKAQGIRQQAIAKAEQDYKSEVEKLSTAVQNKKTQFKEEQDLTIRATISVEQDSYINAIDDLIKKFGGQ